MPQLLLELLSEEIPARMQARAASDLARLVADGLAAERLDFGKSMSFATPRRLTLVIEDVATASETLIEERKGPRVGAPDKAIEGFLRGAGLSSIEDAETVEDPKKGAFYVARIEKPGRSASQIIAGVVPDVCRKFPWPKSMRWGEADFQWVRPLQSILCLLDGEVVPFEVAGLQSANQTRGHRFHGPDPFAVTDFEDYGRKLLEARVLLPAPEREAMILEDAQALAADAGLELVDDKGLLAENAGLTEWPVALLGTFDEAFLEVPPECLITSMKSHQKCFSLRDPATGKLANRFIMVANLIAADGGDQITAGNEKVIRARLSDAKFFWDQDLKRPLDEMALALDGITFHEKLGSQRERVERIADLAHHIAGSCDADPDDARRAAQLCKADLVSGMVGEFPELQGLMGRYYAEKGGTKPAISRAIELHYKPKGPTDDVPLEEDGDSVAVAVALADKIDTLVGFWAIGEKPTGSGDPYQLRRAALGVIRICIENDLRISMRRKFEMAFDQLRASGDKTAISDDLLAFFADRLKVYLRDAGQRHDLIDAIFALPGQDDIALIVKRIDALSDLLDTDDGANLLAGVKRATNILNIEEKKDKRTFEGEPTKALFKDAAERDLSDAIDKVKTDVGKAIDVERFDGAMRALAELRAPVDAFFDTVKVNVDEPDVRENRLKLLAQIRETTLKVADFSKIAG